MLYNVYKNQALLRHQSAPPPPQILSQQETAWQLSDGSLSFSYFDVWNFFFQ